MSTYTLNAAALATRHAAHARDAAEHGSMATAREELDRARGAADIAARWAAAESTPDNDAPEQFAAAAREAVAEAEAAVMAAAGRTTGAERVTAPVSGAVLELMPADADGTREAREAGVLRGWIERRIKPGTVSTVQFRAAWPAPLEYGWANGRANGLWAPSRGHALNELVYCTRRYAADMVRRNVWAASAADAAEAERAAAAPEPVAAPVAAPDGPEAPGDAEAPAEPVAEPVAAPDGPEAPGDAEAPAEPVAEPVAAPEWHAELTAGTAEAEREAAERTEADAELIETRRAARDLMRARRERERERNAAEDDGR